MTIQIDETIRLELLADVHVQPVYELAAANRNYLREWLTWVDLMQSADFIQSYITGSIARNEEGSEYAFVIIDNEEVVGRIGVYKIDRQNKICEIGYWVGEQQQGKGIVIRSCKGLIDFCFTTLQLNRIEIQCGTENLKSQTIPERLHFKKEGVRRQGGLVNGQFIDLCLYSLLKEEYSAGNKGDLRIV
jgi:ribosomal-protein-serine acetyltransferase